MCKGGRLAQGRADALGGGGIEVFLGEGSREIQRDGVNKVQGALSHLPPPQPHPMAP